MRLSQTLVLAIATVFLCCNTLLAQGTVVVRQPEVIPADRVLTLQDCINLALKNQSSIRQAEAQIRAEAGAVTQARSGLLPSTSAATSTQVAGGTGNRRTQITFSGNQLVYDFGRSPALLSQAERLRTAGTQNLAATAANVVLSVKQAYYTLLQDTHLVDVFAQNLAQQQAHVAETQAREQAGVSPHTNVLNAQAAAASAQFDLITAQNNANLARVNLNAAMGIDLHSAIRIAEASEPATPVPAEDQAIALAIANRPELSRDFDQIRAAQAFAKAASTGYFPALTTSASYTPNPGATGGFGQRQSWALLLNLQWNFFNSGATTGAVQQARAQTALAEETLYADRQTVTNEVVQSRLNIISAEAQLASALAEVASAQANLDAALGSYNAGVGIFLAVIDAQAALLKAQVDEFTARYGLSIARAQLQHATGGAIP